MREALLKKRYGIPAALLVLLIGIGAVVAAGLSVVSITGEIKYPTHQSLSLDFGDIPAGGSSSESVEGFFGLPAATYDMAWTLSGDVDNFSSINIVVKVDLNGNGNYEGKEIMGTLTKDETQISASGVTGPPGQGVLETTAEYDVSVTVADNVRAGTSIASDAFNLVVSWDATKA